MFNPHIDENYNANLFMDVVDEFPFANLDNKELLTLFNDTIPASHIDYLSTCIFDPLSSNFDNYIDGDVNFFYNNVRNLTIPQSQFIFMHKYSSLKVCNDKLFTILSTNILSVTANLQSCRIRF